MDQQRSMTSWARRSISGLPRCTESKSRASELEPVVMDEAAPPPRPMRMPGPPRTIRRLPGGRHVLLRLVVADVADAAGEHDRLVVAVARAADVGFERAEVAEDVRTAELVVEGGAAERAFRHDRERRGDAGRSAVLGIRLFTRHRVGVVFKTLRKFRQVEVRGREAAQAGLRTSTAARRTFVADFAAGARGGSRGTEKWRRVLWVSTLKTEWVISSLRSGRRGRIHCRSPDADRGA